MTLDKSKQLDVTYDVLTDTLIVEGVKYAGDLMRAIGGAFGEGICIKIVRDGETGRVNCKAIKEASQ